VDLDPAQQGEAYQGFSPSTYGASAPYVPPVAPPPVPYVRPLSTGEVLDRTFTLYRQRFWLFVGIGMLPAGTLLLTSSIRLLWLALTHQTSALRPSIATAPGASANVVGALLASQMYFLPLSFLFLIAYGISHAATVDAVNRIGLGAEVSVGEAYGAVRGRWLRWCGIVTRQFWSMAWPVLPGLAAVFGMFAYISARRDTNNPALIGVLTLLGLALMLGGLVLGVINFIRNTLAVAASVTENIGVNAAMRRSKVLVAGRKGRIFLALLLFYALEMVIATIQMPLLFAAMNLRGGAFVAVQAVTMLIQFVAVALVSPVASIAFTLFYIDERVRREGYDIELLMRRTLPMADTAALREI